MNSFQKQDFGFVELNNPQLLEINGGIWKKIAEFVVKGCVSGYYSYITQTTLQAVKDGSHQARTDAFNSMNAMGDPS